MPNKEDFQQELKEKVKEGVKPSDLRKLKKSKSTGDIPKASPLPQSTPLTRSSSAQSPVLSDTKYPYTTLISQQQTIEKLEKETQTKSTTISLLRKRNEELESQLQKVPPTPLLNDQLKEKQKEVESLRKQLEEKNTTAELDTALLARHKSLKDWWKQYQKSKNLDEELTENIDQASEELINQDKRIVDLQSEVRKLKKDKASLQKDLNLSQRVSELRKDYLPDNGNFDYLKYALYSLLAVGFTLWLVNNLKNKENQ